MRVNSAVWHPEGLAERYGRRPRPAVGEVVAYARAAWEVQHIEVDDPTQPEQEYLDRYPEPSRDALMPFRVTLRRLHGPAHEKENSARDIGRRFPAGHYKGLPRYKDGRVPLCSCHGHPWPCLEADQQAEAAQAAKAAEHEMQLLPGCCPACQEPVTHRQQSITFTGPYLRNPLAPTDPTFHLRRSCYSAAARYEEQWVAANPAVHRRSLLTLTCKGHIVVHGDGTAECHGDPDCPSVHASHRAYSACYLQSHGCGRGCTTAGHPGTRVAGRPVHPREVTALDGTA